MSSRGFSVTTSRPIMFHVHNHGEYAEIAVCHGTEGDRGWVSVAIRSSYGNFGHFWNSIGPGKWSDFLNQIDLHYTMMKLSDQSIYEFDSDATLISVREKVLRYRKEGTLDRNEARNIWNTLEYYVDESTGPEMFCQYLREHDIFVDDTSGNLIYALRPSIQAFWDRIWRPWIMYVANTEAANAA